MAKAPKEDRNFLEDMEKSLQRTTDGLGRMAQQHALALDPVGAAKWVGTPYIKALKSLWARLKQALSALFDQLGPNGAAGAAAGFVAAGIEDLIGLLNETIDTVLQTPGAIADGAFQVVLGLIEAIKKAIRLVLDGLKATDLTRAVEIILDLINNLIGNMAEAISPEVGKHATKLRANMYAQVTQVRRSEAARTARIWSEEPMEDV